MDEELRKQPGLRVVERCSRSQSKLLVQRSWFSVFLTALHWPLYHYSHHESIWFWSLSDIIWPLNPMMEKRQEWDTGKPQLVSWKATAGRNSPSCKRAPRGAVRLVLGWATLSELWVHFEQPHLTSSIFRYSPTEPPRERRCDSSNLSPIDWPGKAARVHQGCCALTILLCPGHQIPPAPFIPALYMRSELPKPA